MSVELEVPQASIDAVEDVHFTLESESLDPVAAARAIARPMVVAELRARAKHLGWLAARVAEYDADVLREIERDLNARANELEGGAQ